MRRWCGIWKIRRWILEFGTRWARAPTAYIHTYIYVHTHVHIQESAYTIACFVPRNFVRHARCCMLCALPVTRILNTEFNFFLLPVEWSLAIFAFAKYAIIGSHLASIELTRSIYTLTILSAMLELFLFKRERANCSNCASVLAERVYQIGNNWYEKRHTTLSRLCC